MLSFSFRDIFQKELCRVIRVRVFFFFSELSAVKLVKKKYKTKVKTWNGKKKFTF